MILAGLAGKAIVSFLERELMALEPAIQAWVLEQVKNMLEHLGDYIASKVGIAHNGDGENGQ